MAMAMRDRIRAVAGAGALAGARSQKPEAGRMPPLAAPIAIIARRRAGDLKAARLQAPDSLAVPYPKQRCTLPCLALPGRAREYYCTCT